MTNEIAKLTIKTESQGSTKATSDLDKLTSASDRAEKSVKKTGEGVKGFGRKAGQASIQVEQLITSISGGANPTQALAFQAADLGIVLGAPLIGSIVAVTAALAGPFIASLFSAGVETDALIERIEKLSESNKLAGVQSKFLAEQKKLEVQALSDSNLELAKQINELERLQDLRTSAGVGTDTGQFAIPKTAEENQKRYSKAIKETSSDLVALRAELATNNQEIIGLNQDITDLTTGNFKNKESVESLQESLINQITVLEQGAQAAEIYALNQKLAGTSQEDQIPALTQLINRKFELKEAQEQAAKTSREEAAAQRKSEAAVLAAEKRYESVSNSIYRQIVALEEGEEAAFRYGVAQQLGLESAKQIPDTLQAQIDKLYELKEAQDNLSGAAYWAEWLESAEKNLTNFDELSTSVIENFSRQMGDSLVDIVSQTSSVKDAFGDLMRGVALSTVNALGQMAAQWLAYQAVQLFVGKTTAASGAAALTANAQASSLQAGINAFSSTAAIPVVGPTLAPGAMAAALAVTQPMAAAVSALAATGAIAGARELGGPVLGGKSYLVGEKGPEVFTPGAAGQITSNANLQRAMGEGGGMTFVFSPTVNARYPGDVIEELQQAQKSFARMVQSVTGKPV